MSLGEQSPRVEPFVSEGMSLSLGDKDVLRVGDTPESVAVSYRKCMRDNYKRLYRADPDTIHEFQCMVLAEMLKYYGFTQNIPCLQEVKRLIDDMPVADALAGKVSELLDRIRDAKRHKRTREPLAYRDDLERCFQVAKGVDAEWLRGRLEAVCRELVNDKGLDAKLFGDVPAVLCGDRRDVIVRSDRGYADDTKKALVLLVRIVVEERGLCEPCGGLSKWEAAQQAFLKSHRRPYAEENYSRTLANDSAANTLRAVIERGLEGKGQSK